MNYTFGDIINSAVFPWPMSFEVFPICSYNYIFYYG